MATAITRNASFHPKFDGFQKKFEDIARREALLRSEKVDLVRQIGAEVLGGDSVDAFDQLWSSFAKDQVPAVTAKRPGRPKGQVAGTSKREFVENLFHEDPEISLASVQERWSKEHEGTISTSLVYKTLGELRKGTRSGKPGRRRGGRRKKTTEAKTSSHVSEPTGDLNAEVQRAALEILGRRAHKKIGLQVADITEIMEKENLLGEHPISDLAKIVQTEVKKLREEKLVERGNNRQYHLV